MLAELGYREERGDRQGAGLSTAGRKDNVNMFLDASERVGQMMRVKFISPSGFLVSFAPVFPMVDGIVRLFFIDCSR